MISRHWLILHANSPVKNCLKNALSRPTSSLRKEWSPIFNVALCAVIISHICMAGNCETLQNFFLQLKQSQKTEVWSPVSQVKQNVVFSLLWNCRSEWHDWSLQKIVILRSTIFAEFWCLFRIHTICSMACKFCTACVQLLAQTAVTLTNWNLSRRCKMFNK